MKFNWVFDFKGVNYKRSGWNLIKVEES